MGKYFGTSGIREVFNEKLTPELALKVGKALGT
jgi:phosphoglucosamine mutase